MKLTSAIRTLIRSRAVLPVAEFRVTTPQLHACPKCRVVGQIVIPGKSIQYGTQPEISILCPFCGADVMGQ